MTRRLTEWLVIALAAGALLSFVLFAWALFLTYPPVWPDEALWASPAIELVRRGRLATPLLAGALPGIETRTYWIPPLYPLYLAGAFLLGGVSIETVRLSSIAAAVAVMAALYGLARATGLTPVRALLPVALVAVDRVFLRGALIGRMDMLALACIVTALWLYVKGSSASDASGSRAFVLAGAFGGLAVLTHPLGVVAVLALLGAHGARGERARASRLIAGSAVPILLWLLYACVDLASFVSQFGGQLVRKASIPADGWASALGFLLAQNQIRQRWVALAWLVGLLGLVLRAKEDRRCFVLPLCLGLMLPVVVLGRELWYPVYLVPLTSLGIVHALGSAQWPARMRLAAAGLLSALAISVAVQNLRVSVADARRVAVEPDAGASYRAWCARIGHFLPAGSTVMLALIPDPFFGLMGREDLALREALPDRVSTNAERYRQFLAEVDIAVVNRWPVSNEVDRLVATRGMLIAEIGSPEELYYARVYRVEHSK